MKKEDLTRAVAQKYLWKRAKEAARNLASKFMGMPWWLGVTIMVRPDKTPYLEVRVLELPEELPSSWEGFEVESQLGSMPKALKEDLL